MSARSRRAQLSRRSFLRGAAGVSVALPFLESLPERSAWAANERPVFAFFICAVGGVVPSRFLPNARGPLTTEALASSNKATGELARHASNLLFISGIDWHPLPGSGDAHAQTLCTAFTGRPSQAGSNDPMSSCYGDRATDATCWMGSGPSADAVIAAAVHAKDPPLVLTSGNPRNGYIGERLSFTGPGLLNRATDNPYVLYQQLTGLLKPGGESAAKLLLDSRASVHDLVREELTALLRNPRLSSADRQRLELHFDSIREIETTMGTMGDETLERCTSEGLNLSRLEALKTFAYDSHRTEEIAQLHMSLVALAFACNYRRAASLQWGDAYDQTIYAVPSNERGWKFSHISHGAQSDTATGDDLLAEQAHIEIDALRMSSLASALDQFHARGLRDQCFVLWTNNFADGPKHTTKNVPHILWGNAGGYLKQGEYLDAGSVTNNRLHNALISAAIRDTGKTMEDFGTGTGGQLEAVLA